MKVVLVSRYPRVDRPAWKRALAEGLLGHGVELALVYSHSGLVDQAKAGLREFGFGAVGRYLQRDPSERLSASEESMTLDQWAGRHGIARHHGHLLTERETTEWIRSFGPDLLILVGADIVPPTVLEIPSVGAINPHYGLLPRYRGMNVTEWSIYHDDPVGVTVHMVDANIDTGDILAKEAVHVPKGATLALIRGRLQETSARLLEQTAMALLVGSVRPTRQQVEHGRQFYRMHPLLMSRVVRRLRDGDYRWLGVEDPPAGCY